MFFIRLRFYSSFYGDSSYSKLGRAYEQATLNLLSKLFFSLNKSITSTCTTPFTLTHFLQMTGNIGDKGIDIRGCLPCPLNTHLIVQCKRTLGHKQNDNVFDEDSSNKTRAYSLPGLASKYIRELEGVWHRYFNEMLSSKQDSSSQRLIAMMVSRSSLSSPSMTYLRTSPVPMAFIRYCEADPADDQEVLAVNFNGGILEIILNNTLQSMIPEMLVVPKRIRVKDGINGWNTFPSICVLK